MGTGHGECVDTPVCVHTELRPPRRCPHGSAQAGHTPIALTMVPSGCWEREEACFSSPSSPQLRERDSGSFSPFPIKETEAQRKRSLYARSLSPQKVPEP